MIPQIPFDTLIKQETKEYRLKISIHLKQKHRDMKKRYKVKLKNYGVLERFVYIGFYLLISLVFITGLWVGTVSSQASIEEGLLRESELILKETRLRVNLLEINSRLYRVEVNIERIKNFTELIQQNQRNSPPVDFSK